MKMKTQLTTDDRNLFALVNKALLSNPFLEKRFELLTKILSRYSKNKKSLGFKLPEIAPILNERLDQLEQKGLKRYQEFINEEDRIIVRNAYLLQIYLRSIDMLNELIKKQLSLGKTLVDVPFADEVIAQLKSRGFSEKDSLHYFALFFQLRRAFYFIDHALVGDCPSMKKLRLALWNNIFTFDVNIYDQHLWNKMEDFSTIFEGETGTGKGSAAAAIGKCGFIPFDRKKRQFTHNFNETFMTINLSQFPESLIESELFGHRKGAFTGAVGHHKGVFERCRAYQSLFLDEIGDITIPVQTKLLQVIQDRIFTPVGSHRQKRFEGRVIAATNRSITELRKQGHFRSDFYYRLCSDVITVPTLRQRIKESPSELEQMVNLLVIRTTGQVNQGLANMILDTLSKSLPPDYHWPGNVRELEQAVRRILLTHKYDGDPLVCESNFEDDLIQKIQSGTLETKEFYKQYCILLYQRFGTYQEVARRTGLDRRTVKKYLMNSIDVE